MHSKHNVQNRKHNYTQKHSADTAKKTTQGQSQSSCRSSRWLNAAFCCSIITFTQLLTCRLLQFPPYRHFWFSAPHWTAGGKLELRVEFEELKMKPACVCVHVYLSLYVGDWSSIAVGNSCIGTVGTAGTWPRSTVTERGNWWRDTDTGIDEQQIHFKFLIKAAIHTLHLRAYLHFFSEWKRKRLCSPDISMALFLKVLMTVPSFLRRRGELRLSATFCFKRERTFRLGSETGRVKREGR